MSTKALTPELLRKLDAWWRAANYLSVGQIYLYDNPLLKQPLKLAHLKPRLLGHWGTTPGLNFIYVHLNRVIKERDLNVIDITGPARRLGWLRNTGRPSRLSLSPLSPKPCGRSCLSGVSSHSCSKHSPRSMHDKGGN